MPLLDFNPKKYLCDRRDDEASPVATDATAATAKSGNEDVAFQGESPLEATSFNLNEIASSCRSVDDPAENRHAAPATVATPQEKSEKANNVNALPCTGKLLQDRYSDATPRHIATAEIVSRSHAILKQFGKTGRFDDAVVVGVLRDASVEFTERAGIAEFDGGLARADAERLALDEFVTEWWDNAGDRHRTRSLTWGDVRRLAFADFLKQVAE